MARLDLDADDVLVGPEEPGEADTRTSCAARAADRRTATLVATGG